MQAGEAYGKLPAGLTVEDMDIGLALALVASGQDDLALKMMREWSPERFAKAAMAAVKFSTMGRDVGLEMHRRYEALIKANRKRRR